MTDDFKDIMAWLDGRRRQYGADTPEGWILSNAFEMFKNLRKAETPEQKAALLANLKETMARIETFDPPSDRQAGEG